MALDPTKVIELDVFECEHCGKKLATQITLNNHLQKCKALVKKNYVLEKELQPLSINEFQLIYRKNDGYIDVTNFCQAGGKEFKHWNSLEKTQGYLRVLSRAVGSPTDLLIQTVTGGKNEDRKTWAHPRVAINIAQWISPEFDVKVSGWVFELMVVGKVELGKETPPQEIEQRYQQQILVLTDKLKKSKERFKFIATKYISSLKTHRYVKFRENDPCFYIIDSGVPCDNCLQYKFGIASTNADQKNDIDDRLQSHRTLWPLLKVRYLLFMKDIHIIEKSFKMMYEKEINPNGHEIIEGVTVEDMVDRVNKLLDMLRIRDYHVMSEEKLAEYNDYVDTTVKPEENLTV